MIIKANNKLYHCENWKLIYQEDEYACIQFFKTFKNEDDDTEFYEHTIELIDEDYYCALEYQNKNYDYKDIRQIKYRAIDMAYRLLLSHIMEGDDFIDLDKLVNQEELAKKAEAEFLKDFEED